MLTKRLYRIDEVRASLLFSIRSRRLYEACFWLKELEDSFYGGEARRLLLLAWSMFVGLQNCSWLYEWCISSNTVEGRMRLCWQLGRCSERDTSLWWTLWAGLLYKDATEQVSKLLDVWQRTYHLDDTDFWQPLVNASVHDKIDICLEHLQEDMRAYTIVARLTGLALVTYQKALTKTEWKPLSTNEPIELQDYLVKWNTDGSVRHQRQYSIPLRWLYGLCWRGIGGDTTTDLQTLSLESLKQSAYWKQQLRSYLNSDGTWESDDKKEEFYDKYFPYVGCDIPDEWPLEDQQKSHGEGLAISNGIPCWRWWDVWIYEHPHMYIWGKGIEVVKDWVKTQTFESNGTILDWLFTLYKKAEPATMNVRKKKMWVLQE